MSPRCKGDQEKILILCTRTVKLRRIKAQGLYKFIRGFLWTNKRVVYIRVGRESYCKRVRECKIVTYVNSVFDTKHYLLLFIIIYYYLLSDSSLSELYFTGQ